MLHIPYNKRCYDQINKYNYKLDMLKLELVSWPLLSPVSFPYNVIYVKSCKSFYLKLLLIRVTRRRSNGIQYEINHTLYLHVHTDFRQKFCIYVAIDQFFCSTLYKNIRSQYNVWKALYISENDTWGYQLWMCLIKQTLNRSA